ncbi:MAG TPA: D-alanyl-D-alanine carboxypeptidase/D-alanyl-D-alanine-endopeptidase [Micromonospora sp.]
MPALATAVLVGVTTTAAAPATAESPSPAVTSLTGALDTLLADARLAGAQAGVVVVDTTTGETLYDRNGGRRLLPASNTKLLTSAAALDLLGADHRFTTDVRTVGPRHGRTLVGDLHLRGTGDPTVLAADYDALAGQVAAAGIDVVEGDLVADDTWFDSRRLGPDWAWDDEGAYYAAQVSALTVAPDTDYDAGTVVVTVRPAASAGEPPVVTLTPPTGYVTVDNRASTVASGPDTISVERRHGGNELVVTGQLAVGAAASTDWIPVWEPTGYAADVFRRALTRHGVRIVGRTVPGRPTPADAPVVATHRSMTLAELMVPFLKLSNNGHAEVLVKSIGRAVSGSGCWSAGLSAIAAHLAALGADRSTLRQADGSGLSRRNLIPPAELADLLLAVRDEPWFPAWYEALPIAGRAERFVGGTLRSRMRDTPAAGNVHAKTGSLTSVSSLSGYVTSADGHLLVFSVVLNNYLASSVKSIEDQIAVTLASWSTGTGVAARVARPAPPAVTDVPDGLECSWVKPVAC